MHLHRAFGLVVASELAWPGCPEVRGAPAADVTLRRGTVELRHDVAPLWATITDDEPVELVRRGDGSHLVTYGDAAFAIAPGAGEVVCDVDPGSPWHLRFLLDTVLLTVAHLRGAELLHGAGVRVDGGAVAILGPSGAGKTTLTTQLLGLGHELVADDVLALDRDGEAIVVHPGPPLANVPRALPCPGEVLAELGDERWVAIPREHDDPVPLRAVVELRRDADGPARVEPLDATPVKLLGHALGFEQSGERDRRRFELFSDVAARVPLLRLAASPDAPPDVLADTLACSISTAPAAAA